jgi:hypothetical protein
MNFKKMRSGDDHWITLAQYQIQWHVFVCWTSRNRAVSVATGYGLEDRETGVRVPVGSRIFSSSRRLDRPALGSIQPPIPWVPGALSPGCNGRGVKLTTHLQLVPRSRKRGSIHPPPHASSWHSAQLVKHRNNFTFYLRVITGKIYLCVMYFYRHYFMFKHISIEANVRLLLYEVARYFAPVRPVYFPA